MEGQQHGTLAAHPLMSDGVRMRMEVAALVGVRTGAR